MAPEGSTRAATGRRTRSNGPARRVDLIFGSHFATAGARGSVCVLGLRGEIREGLCGRMGQGHGQRSLRRGLIWIEQAAEKHISDVF